MLILYHNVSAPLYILLIQKPTPQTRLEIKTLADNFLSTVQNDDGVFEFRNIMDESNNGPDVVDRNEMRGQIFLQPAKTAEFIIIDFNVLPTGAEFPE